MPDLDLTRPFTRSAGLAAGLTPGQLRGPGFTRLFHGVLIDARVRVTDRLRAEAALLTFPPTAFASHTTAGRIWGVALPAPGVEHVTVLHAGDRRQRAGVVCHQRARGRVVAIDGLRVSAAAQLFSELAELLPLVDLVVVGDQLVRRQLVTLDGLAAVVAEGGGRSERLARQAAALVRDRVDSPMETRLRLLLVLAGLPEPVVNQTLRDVDGEPIRRFDLSWPEAKVIVEYDGRQHIAREGQWESDLARREAIDNDGYRILVITARDIYRHPDQTVERVWRVLRDRRQPGVPARPSQAWRAHFAAR